MVTTDHDPQGLVGSVKTKADLDFLEDIAEDARAKSKSKRAKKSQKTVSGASEKVAVAALRYVQASPEFPCLITPLW